MTESQSTRPSSAPQCRRAPQRGPERIAAELWVALASGLYAAIQACQEIGEVKILPDDDRLADAFERLTQDACAMEWTLQLFLDTVEGAMPPEVIALGVEEEFYEPDAVVEDEADEPAVVVAGRC